LPFSFVSNIPKSPCRKKTAASPFAKGGKIVAGEIRETTTALFSSLSGRQNKADGELVKWKTCRLHLICNHAFHLG
jgi:hypothetical protein